MDIGSRLKEAREERNISLESLEEKTKIQKRYLIAIEEENFHLLPGRFYAKAFIKEYAHAVGIEAEDLLDSYDRKHKEIDDENEEYTQVKKAPLDASTSQTTTSFLPRMMVVLLIVGILFAAVYFYKSAANSNTADTIDDNNESTVIRKNDDSNENDFLEQEDEDDAELEDESDSFIEEEDEEDEAEVSFNVTTVGSGNSPHSTIEVSGLDDAFEVNLEATGDSWISLKDDQNNTHLSEQLGENNSSKTIEIERAKRLDFTIGDASSLTIEINGEQLQYPVDPEQHVFQKITLEIVEATN